MTSEFVKTFIKNGITLEPFLTKRCNWECDFCMYSCSPKSSGEFISDGMLLKLKKQVDFLQALRIPVTINLMGGEPSLYPEKLKKIVDMIADWNVFITLPTNGWWLETKKATATFMDIFKNHVSADGNALHCNNGHGLLVQISDEKYHQMWRKGSNNKAHFNELFPNLDAKFPWIRWQTLSDNYYINPQGRARELSNAKDYIEKYAGERKILCWSDENYAHRIIQNPESIHYEVDGTISSGCQFGNDSSGIGTIDDNILYIIGLLRMYKEYRKSIGGYNCYNCNTMFQEWKNTKMEEEKQRFSPLNTFDVEMWA